MVSGSSVCVVETSVCRTPRAKGGYRTQHTRVLERLDLTAHSREKERTKKRKKTQI